MLEGIASKYSFLESPLSSKSGGGSAGSGKARDKSSKNTNHPWHIKSHRNHPSDSNKVIVAYFSGDEGELLKSDRNFVNYARVNSITGYGKGGKGGKGKGAKGGGGRGHGGRKGDGGRGDGGRGSGKGNPPNGTCWRCHRNGKPGVTDHIASDKRCPYHPQRSSHTNPHNLSPEKKYNLAVKLRNEAIKAGRKSIEGGKQARKAFQQAVKAAREADDDDPAQAAFGWVMYFQSPNVYNFNVVNLLNSLRNHHNIEYFLSDSGSTHHILNNEKLCRATSGC